jgi:hypothetical protein
VPKYDTAGKKIISYSSLSLPQVITAPQFVISNEDRNTVVLQGTLYKSSKTTSKKHEKGISSPVFCGKDVTSLPDGTYVFRIAGALSKEHKHSDTKWEFCGRRGTSDEELKFTINKKKCTVVEQHSRFDVMLVDYSSSLTIQFSSVAQVTTFGESTVSESVLEDLETALSVGAINSITSLNGISLTSVVMSGGLLKVSFRVRLDPTYYMTNGEFNQELMTADVHSKLGSDELINNVSEELHKYSEFEAVSKVTLNDVQYEGSFQTHSLGGREFTTTVEKTDFIVSNKLYYALCALGILSVVIAAFMSR